MLLSWVLGLTLLFYTSLGNCADDLIPVGVTKAEKKVIHQEIPLSASVMARRMSSLSAKVDGLVSEVLVEEGSFVNRDEVLIRLNPVLAELNLTRAEAEVEEGKAQLTEAIRQRDEAAKLVAKRHVSATAFKATIADVAIREAVVKRLQAELKHQRETVERHKVQAPFAGVIGKKLVEIGQWVDQGDAVAELVELDYVRINVDVPQRYFQRVISGAPVVVRFDAMPKETFAADITFKIPVADPASRTFPVRIDIQNQHRRIIPGMSARVVFLLTKDGSEPVVTLPRDTIVQMPDGSEVVWRVIRQQDGWIVESLNVRTGFGIEDRVRILGDKVRAGDLIVIRGNEILKSGQKVRIINQ